MAILLLAAFIAVPVIEIAAFIEVGGWIGLWPTIGIVIATAFAGTTLLRLQGLAVLRRFQESASRNELPVTEVFDGLCLLIAGALLLTPGVFHRYTRISAVCSRFSPPCRAGCLAVDVAPRIGAFLGIRPGRVTAKSAGWRRWRPRDRWRLRGGPDSAARSRPAHTPPEVAGFGRRCPL